MSWALTVALQAWASLGKEVEEVMGMEGTLPQNWPW